MTLRQTIHNNSKKLKSLILNFVQSVIEPVIWKELQDSKEQYRNNGYYIIKDDDFPSIRDLKALLNTLIGLERTTQSYSLWAASIFMKYEFIPDVYAVYSNFNVFWATDSVFTPYFNEIQNFITGTIAPKVSELVNDLGKLLTIQNIKTICNFSIDKLIELEQFQEKRNAQLQQNAPSQPEIITDEKAQVKEGTLTTVLSGLEYIYRKYLGDDKFNLYFTPHKKWDFYPDNEINKKLDEATTKKLDLESDKDTIKNIKRLSNTIIGLNKVFADYEEYSKTKSKLSAAGWLATFASDLKATYSYFDLFDYKAIIAEKSKPLAEYIKLQLQQLNTSLEKVACILDQLEGDNFLKEGFLLQLLDIITERYNQITTELNIPINYAIQKRTFYTARIDARDKNIKSIDAQITCLELFIAYKNHALITIPKATLNQMLGFITNYEGDLCINKDIRSKYKAYLQDAINATYGIKSFFKSKVEYVGNLAHMTVHHQMMNVLATRRKYLQRETRVFTGKLKNTIQKHDMDPYDLFKLDELKNYDPQKIIHTSFVKRLGELNDEIKSITNDLIDSKKDVNTDKPVADIKSISINLKDEKASVAPQKTVAPTERIRLQIKSKLNEIEVFKSGISEIGNSSNIPDLIDSMRKTDYLSYKSIVLLDEIKEILRVSELRQSAIVLSDSKDLHGGPPLRMAKA